jgi:hypothetical protein
MLTFQRNMLPPFPGLNFNRATTVSQPQTSKSGRISILSSSSHKSNSLSPGNESAQNRFVKKGLQKLQRETAAKYCITHAMQCVTRSYTAHTCRKKHLPGNKPKKREIHIQVTKTQPWSGITIRMCTGIQTALPE